MKKNIPTNPIVIFLNELLASGKMTKEKICVACDLKYPTFDNTFNRPVVSLMIKKSLKYCGIVPQKVIEAYDEWYQRYYVPTKGKKSANPKASSRSEDFLSGEDTGVEDYDDAAGA